MFFFILQTLFLAFVAFLLGWLLGRFIKGFFCKSTDTPEPRKALKTELGSSKEDHSTSDSSRVTKSAVVSTAAATATAAVIAKMASDVKDESSVDKVSDTRNTIVEESPLVGKTDDVSSDIKATIEKISIVDTVKQSDEETKETKETLKNSVVIDNVENKINDSVVDLENKENKENKEKNAPVRHLVDKAKDRVIGDSVEIKNDNERLKETGFDEISNIMSGTAGVLSEKDVNKDRSKAVDTQNDDSSTLFDSAKALAVAAGVGIAAKTGTDAIKGADTVKEIATELGEATKNSVEKTVGIDDVSFDKRIHSVVINNDVVVTSEVILEEKLTKTPNDLDLDLSKGEALKEERHLVGNIEDKLDGVSNGLKTVVEKNDIIDQIKEKTDSVSVDLKDAAEKSNLIDQAKEKISDVANGAVTLKNDVIDNIKDKVDSVSVDLKDVVEKSNLIDQAKEKISGVADGAVAIKNDVIENNVTNTQGEAHHSTLFDIAKATVVAAGAGIVAKVGVDAVKSGDDTAKKMLKETGEVIKDKSEKTSDVLESTAENIEVKTKAVDAVFEDSDSIDKVEEKLDNRSVETNATVTEHTLGIVTDTVENTIDDVSEKIVINAQDADDLSNRVSETSEAVLSLEETKVVDTHDDDRATVLDIAKASAVAAVAGIVAKKQMDDVTNISDDNVKKNEDIIDKNEKALEKEFAKKIEGFSDSIPDELNFTHNMDAKITDRVDDKNILSKTPEDVILKDEGALLDHAKATMAVAGSAVVVKKLSSEGFDDDKVNHITKEDDGEITILYRYYNLCRFRSSSRNVHGVNLPSRNIRRFSSSPSNNRRFIAIRKIDDKIF